MSIYISIFSFRFLHVANRGSGHVVCLFDPLKIRMRMCMVVIFVYNQPPNTYRFVDRIFNMIEETNHIARDSFEKSLLLKSFTDPSPGRRSLRLHAVDVSTQTELHVAYSEATYMLKPPTGDTLRRNFNLRRGTLPNTAILFTDFLWALDSAIIFSSAVFEENVEVLS